MINVKKTLILSMFLSSLALAAPTPPGPVPGGMEPEVDFRGFYNHDAWSFFGEAKLASETDKRVFKKFMAGGYYQLLDQLKVGAFFQRAYGVRHDEDWVKNGTIWNWRETNSRGESSWMIDATPRFKLDAIHMEQFVFEFKTRFINNIYNHHQTLFVRPGLTYFWLKDDQAFLNFFLQYEMQLGLNFGPQVMHERWLYLGTLYNACPTFDLGLYTALKWENWGSYADYTAKGGPAFNTTTQTFVLGLLGILHFGN